MVDPNYEIQRDADLRTRVATESFCEECGYNLYSLPERGRCPECGNTYRAGGGAPDGVFAAHTVPFPIGDLLLASAGLWGLVVMVHGLFQEFELWSCLLAVALLITVPKFLLLTWRGIRRFMTAQRVAAGIRDRESYY